LRTTITEVRFGGQGGAPLAPELTDLLAGISAPAGEQSVRVVCDLRDQAQARLRSARYVTSVQIPQQRLDGGLLRLEVISGRITEMRVSGEAGPYENLLKARIDRLKALDPLNEAEAERILLLAGDVPGLSVQLGLSPAGGAPGDLIGDLNVSFTPFRMLANVQNYNSKFLGRETALLHAEVYGLAGRGDVTSLTAQSTFDFEEQLIAQLRHAVTLNTAGTTLALRGTVARSRPDLKTLDLRTLSLIGGLEVTQPIERTVNRSLSVSGGFEYSQQRTRVHFGGGSSPLNRDRISSVYLRMDGENRSLRMDGSVASSLRVNAELRKGLDMLKATRTGVIVNGYGPTRFEGSATATILRGEVEAMVSPSPLFELAGRVRGQWANRPLLNFEEFAIGNQTIGRGYDPGANTGDRAVAFTVEPRVNFDLADIGR
ncbi:MAG TPA: ShlB/FhaC/HecB family hemolysin secretion/activation protein, partial [Novosphingobium sp.]|nr:ShlB/FhaC/HecB family hemolysin secretion/activation protein [Novosphingobium sp.]